jgi:hypothetical protein
MTRNFLRALTGWGMLALAGCATLPMGDTVRGPVYVPANVHRSIENLPITVRRVALLPATARIGEVEASGADAVSGILLAELQRQHRLEVFHVNRADLARWSGRRDWAVADQLPSDFLDSVRKHTGAEAVLFPEITTYRAAHVACRSPVRPGPLGGGRSSRRRQSKSLKRGATVLFGRNEGGK